MSIPLRRHQRDAIAAAYDVLDSRNPRAGVWCLPTGTDATTAYVTFAHGQSGRTLVLVQRDDQVRDVCRTAQARYPHQAVGVIQGSQTASATDRLVVASVRSLEGERLQAIDPQDFPTVVVDGCQHAPAPRWRAVLNHLQPHFLLGVTPTPDRRDGQGIDHWFGPKPIYRYTLDDAVADGLFVPARRFRVHALGVDAFPQTNEGDERSQGVNTSLHNRLVLDAYLQHAPRRKAVIFAANRVHVAALAANFAYAGVPVISVTGAMPSAQRPAAFAQFRSLPRGVLINCRVCVEGYDEPSVDCIILARPCASRPMYEQCVSLGMRRAPASRKYDCLVLDTTAASQQHTLAAPLHLNGPLFSADASDAAVPERLRERAVEQIPPLLTEELTTTLVPLDRT